MNIGINGYEAVVPRFGFDKNTGLPNRVGSGEFSYENLVALFKIESKNNYFIYLPISPSSDMPDEKSNWKYEVITSKKIWTLTGLGKRLMKNENKLDVFFSQTHYLPFGFKIPSVVTILDVSYLHFPELFKKKDLIKLKYWGRYSIKKANKIITISESSKSDIIKAYKVPVNKIEVIYPGIKEVKLSAKHSMKDLEENFGIEGKYILFVGTLQPRKNIVKLIEAFSKLDSDLKLVIIGKKGWQYEEILNAPEKYGVADRVIFLHNVGDEDLPSFYKNAEMFVLPSLYEGFGLPVIEAMKYNCPVITSNVSSLPEAGGDAALYVDPTDATDIKNKMEKLIKDDKLRHELVEKGNEQVKKFSWERSAKETLAVLENI